jgi:hypothetical protein
MAGLQDFYDQSWDFEGPSVAFPTSADPATPWLIADTSAAGAPTYVRASGEAVLTMAATSEVENLCLYHGDALTYDIDGLFAFEARVKVTGCTSGTSLCFGMASARNDTQDSVAANAWFKMVGADSTTAVVVETDDGTTDLDDKATGATLSTTYKRFAINFRNKKDVKFYIDGVRVAQSTTFDMSAYTSGLQPLIQLQKTSSTNADAITIDYVRVNGKRV